MNEVVNLVHVIMSQYKNYGFGFHRPLLWTQSDKVTLRRFGIPLVDTNLFIDILTTTYY